MKKLSGILILISLLTACHSKSGSDGYEKNKETLEQQEKENPLRFLSISNHNKHNLLGQTVIKVTITNNAKICVYKDIGLELAFYSKTGTLLEKDAETIYDEIAPGNSIEHKTKYYAPKGTDSVSIKIAEAKTQ